VLSSSTRSTTQPRQKIWRSLLHLCVKRVKKLLVISWLDRTHIRIEIVDCASAGDLHAAGAAHNSRGTTLKREDLRTSAHGSTDGVDTSINGNGDGLRAGSFRECKKS
jgi:hypothetical protein